MNKHDATPRSPEARFADIVATLRARYAPTTVPPCRVCGGELSIASVGGGEPTRWACSEYEDDPDVHGQLRRKPDRSMADAHYGDSRWVDYRQGGDSDVIELLDLLAAGAVPLAAAERSSKATDGAARIAAERQRQIAAEGYTPDHDDLYTNDELLQAATTYIGTARSPDDSGMQKRASTAGVWPWHARFFKPQNRARDLERAGGLIAAELDRMKRAEKARR